VEFGGGLVFGEFGGPVFGGERGEGARYGFPFCDAESVSRSVFDKWRGLIGESGGILHTLTRST
jgi:hypothetical protein